MAKVEFNGGGEVAVLPIADISAGGVRLSIGPDDLIELDIDEQVQVFLTAENGSPAYVSVPASVVRLERGEPAHVALEWREPPSDSERFAEVLRILQESTRD